MNNGAIQSPSGLPGERFQHVHDVRMYSWLHVWPNPVFLALGLATALATQGPLKVEKQDKEDMQDHSSDDLKSDDESDKRDVKTPRGGTRTR